MKFLLKIEYLLFILLIILLPSQLAKHFWPPYSYISGIRIDYLSPALYFNDLIIFLLFSMAIFRNRRNIIKLLIKKYEENNKLNIFKKNVLFYFLLFVIINILISSRKLITVYYWIRVFQLIALYFYLKFNSKSFKAIFLKYLPIPVIYSSIIAILQLIKQGSLGGFLYWLGERRFSLSTPGIAKTSVLGRLFLRPYATFPHPNALAGFILLATIVSFYGKKQKRFFSLNLIYYFLSILTIILSFSQSTLILALLWGWFLVFHKLRSKNFKNIFILLLVFLLFPTFLSIEKQSFTIRYTVFLRSIDIIKEHLLFGVGMGNFIPALFENNKIFSINISPFLYFQPVHNIYLLYISEMGLTGFALIAYMMYKLLRKLRKLSFELKLTFIVVFVIGLIDHYWLTLYQNRLFLTLLVAFF